MATKLVIGSRESKLAVVQAELIRSRLRALHPDWEISLKTYKSTGDMILDRTLDKVGGKGLFTKELEDALLRGEADLLVHSLKDVPMQVDERIPLSGVSRREDPRDALVLPEGKPQLDASAPIGCSSLRRTLQLRRLYPGVEIKPVRGNVQTRLSKLDGGEYGALCLAAAGLRRLGLEGRISRLFTSEEVLPAACQGVLALQLRAESDRSVLDGLSDDTAFAEARCERAFVRALDGGCSSPVAAYAVANGGRMALRGLYVEPDNETMHFDAAEGAEEDGETIGTTLALAMKKRWENG